jgi:hypothetical protein
VTVTEDLVLLLLSPDTGRSLVDSTSLDRAIGGALLLDLAISDRITADGDGAKARLSVVDAAPTGDPLLDDALGERPRLLGVLPVTTWPAADPGPGKELRGRVAAVLRDGAQADQHLALLISLVHAVKAEHKIVEGARRQLRARAAEVAEGDWAGQAVCKAVQAVQTSVATAVAVSAAVSDSSSG